MAVTAKCLLEAKYAELAQTTQLTAPTGTRYIIDKFTAYNGTAGAVALTVSMIASGGAASADEIIASKAIAAGETYTFPEVVGQVMNAGDFISTLAGAATSIVIRISGREVT